MADYFLSIGDSLRALGLRAQQLRLLRNLTQAELGKNAGVGIKVVRRFESSGQGSMESIVRIAVALGAQEAFGKLFEAPPFTSLAQAESQAAIVTRKRARKRR